MRCPAHGPLGRTLLPIPDSIIPSLPELSPLSQYPYIPVETDEALIMAWQGPMAQSSDLRRQLLQPSAQPSSFLTGKRESPAWELTPTCPLSDFLACFSTGSPQILNLRWEGGTTQPLEIHPSLGTDKRKEKAWVDNGSLSCRPVSLSILSHQSSPQASSLVP